MRQNDTDVKLFYETKGASREGSSFINMVYSVVGYQSFQVHDTNSNCAFPVTL